MSSFPRFFAETPMQILSVVSLVLLAHAASAQIALPNYTSSFTSNATRGFFFQTPVPFVLTHVQVPDETGKGKQMVAVYKLTAAPPAFSQSVNVTPLFFMTGVDSKKIIQVSPPLIFQQNDWVAVLGACGPDSGSVSNSYGAGNYSSSILGQKITLLRCLIQTNLASVKGVYGMSSEGTASIARVRLFVSGHGRAEKYGTGTSLGTITAPELAVSDPSPPSIGATAAMILKPGNPSNTGGILAISTLQSNIPVGPLTLLNFPFFTTLPVAGPIAANGTTISFPLPNDTGLLGAKATFQAAVGVQGGVALTDGMLWTVGK
jgi:hypothetical protein